MKVELMKHLQTSVMIHLVYAVGFRENSIQNLDPVFCYVFFTYQPPQKPCFFPPVQVKCLKMHVLESQKCL